MKPRRQKRAPGVRALARGRTLADGANMSTRIKRRAAVISRCIETLENRVLLSATHLPFLSQPTDTASGSSIAPSIRVAVEDGSNNVVTTDTSTVVMAIKSGTGDVGATLGGLKSVAAVNGIATFSLLSIDIAASGYKLTATDGGLTAANSNSFAINPGAATKLVFNAQPADATAGATLDDITVDVEDANGNIVDSDGSNITLSIKTGPTG